MRKRDTLLTLALLAGIASLFWAEEARAQDWTGVPIPAEADEGLVWQLQEAFSDDFNYTGKGAAFAARWRDTYINTWIGPGLTEWAADHSVIGGGHLVINASRKAGTKKVHCGVVTSPVPLIYPVFMEASIQVSGLVLSSNFWLLSADDRQELDIVETYGSDRSEWFAQRMSTNYHIFERSPETNEILANHNDQQFSTLPDGAPLRQGFHRFAAYWKDPWHVDFFLDGVLVRRLRRDGITDPEEDKGLYRPMFLIIDTEDHDWRSDQDIVASDEELTDESINKMRVDWVRVYKPVEANAPSAAPDQSWGQVKQSKQRSN
ncbi:MAG: family 16 glycosylhydrolase [Candidatus Latescibacteria bacterium]|nr:family 16 glycosylhydrolase [Candidatus Latescibacterota bacterium]